MSNAVIIIPNTGGRAPILSGAPSGNLSSGGVAIGFQPTYIPPVFGPLPVQIMGLVPLIPCVATDCRDLADKSMFCYLNPVFGSTGTKSTYQNDFNSFFLNYIGTGSCQFVIQRQTNSFYNNQPDASWSTVATVSDNTYGAYYPIGSLLNQPTILGFTVNWGKVLTAFGAGIYRISVNLCVVTYTPATVTLAASGPSNPNGLPAQVVNGTITIGNWVAPISYTSLTAAVLAYICALINASGIATATVVGSTIVVDGPKGSSIIIYTTDIQQPYIFPLIGGSGPAVGSCTCAYNSVPFLLRAWNCDQAHGTVKFETLLSGTIGDVENDGQFMNLCNITFYDSIRMRGFFGFTEFGYDEVMVEWGINNTEPFGLVERVRDKAVRGYKFDSYWLPQWFHDRFATYGLMADTLQVSDYNHNNSDYTLYQRTVIKAGDYKPEYLDTANFDPQNRIFNRRAQVKMNFKQGIQGIIKSINCQIAP